MSDLKATIKTSADLKGVKEAAQGIRDVKAAAQETTPKLAENEQAHKSLGEQVEKVARAKHGLVAAFRELSHQVPLLGQAIHALKNPYTLLALTIGAVVYKAKEFIDTVDEMEKRMEKFRSIGATFQDFFTLREDARARSAEFKTSIEDIAKSVDLVAHKFEDANKKITQYYVLIGDLAKAKEAAELAQLATGIQQGAVTPTAAAQIERNIKERYAKEADQRRLEQRQVEFVTASNAQRAAAAEAERAKREEEAAGKARDQQKHQSDVERALAEATLEHAKEELPKAEAAEKAARERRQQLESSDQGPPVYLTPQFGGHPRLTLEGAQTAERQAEARTRLLRHSVDEAKALQNHADNTEQEAKKRYEETADRARHYEQEEQNYGRRVQQLRASAAQEDIFLPQIRAAEASRLGFETAGKLTAAQQEARRDLQQLADQVVKGQQNMGEAITKALQALAGSQDKLARDFESYLRREYKANSQ